MALSIRPRIRTIFTAPNFSFTEYETHCSSSYRNKDQVHSPLQNLHASGRTNIFEFNAHLKQLVKAGRLNDARKMFDKMPHRDEISWTNMISGYVNGSHAYEALRLFSTMWVRSELRFDQFVLSLALKACGITMSLCFGEVLHGCSVKSGLVNSVFVGTSLIDMYTKTGKIDESCRVFEDMPIRNVVSWTAIIAGLVHAGFYSDGLAYFSEMWRSKVSCDAYAYAIALKACADSSALNHGKAIHTQTLKKRLNDSSFVANSLAAMYNKCGKLESGFHLLLGMKTRDVVSWTTIITTYAQQGREKNAVEAFVRMRESGVSPNDYTFASLISCCANLARIEWGEQFHAHVLRLGLADYSSVANSVVTMYSKCGRLGSASTMFRAMKRKNIVSWSSIIAGYCQGGHGEEAFELFSGMRRDGPKPSEFALASLLSVCGSMSILDQGRQFHAHVFSVGLENKSLIQSSLISMYSKCGSIDEASRVFESIERDDIVTWTAMIGGYAEHGYSREAIALFERITEVGLRPDTVAFVGVLTACSHAGLVDLGFRYFESMVSEHRIEPSREHYGCVVDLLCRVGRLSDAERVIRAMPCARDDVVWSSLLRACRARGDVERGRRAAEEILEMNPSCAGTHVTMANLYAAEGKWKEASELRRVLNSKGVTKEPGWSWIKVKDRLSAFVAGDGSHAQWEQICSVSKLLVLKPEIADEESTSLLLIAED